MKENRFSRKVGDTLLRWKPFSFLIGLSGKMVLPGFQGLPLYDVAGFFIGGLRKGYITSRASAISFSFFLSVFPFLIFLFTIIPFIPIGDFQQTLMELVGDLMPDKAYESVEETLVDIITRPRSSLLILNFILTLYFSTNGVNSLIEAFNNTAHSFESRSVVKQYAVSAAIVMIVSVLLIAAVGLMTFGPHLLNVILPRFILESGFFSFLVQSLRWLIIIGLLLTGLSSIYYLAPARKSRFRFISPGSLLATLLVVVTTLAFNFYVDNFARYNAFYGSIGTLLIVMVWIYVNSISLLIGFELNVSILSARMETGKKI